MCFSIAMQGKLIAFSEFNGSLQYCSHFIKAGNVVFLERTTNGDPSSAQCAITLQKAALKCHSTLLPTTSAKSVYHLPANHHECIVELMITDNHALCAKYRAIELSDRDDKCVGIQCDTPELCSNQKSGVAYT